MLRILRLDGLITSNSDKEFYQWWGYDVVSPEDVDKWLMSGDQDMTLYINSFGGDTMAASQIYTSLTMHGGVDAVIDGYACSAASYTPLGCRSVKISPTGQIMIHNVWTCRTGDYRDMENASEELKTANASIKNVYRLKTGLADDVLQGYMDKETWFDAFLAKELGFVDDVLFTDSIVQIPQDTLNAMQKHTKALYSAIKLPDIQGLREAKRLAEVQRGTGTGSGQADALNKLAMELELLKLR